MGMFQLQLAHVKVCRLCKEVINREEFPLGSQTDQHIADELRCPACRMTLDYNSTKERQAYMKRLYTWRQNQDKKPGDLPKLWAKAKKTGDWDSLLTAWTSQLSPLHPPTSGAMAFLESKRVENGGVVDQLQAHIREHYPQVLSGNAP